MNSISDGQAVYMWMIGLIIGKILHKSGLISLTHVRVGNTQTFKHMYYKNINYNLCVHTRIYYTLYFLLCTVCTYSTLYCSGSYCGLAGLPCLRTKVEGVQATQYKSSPWSLKGSYNTGELEWSLRNSQDYLKLLRSEQKI